MHRFQSAAWILFIGTCAHLAAQDVLVTPVNWADLRDPPEELPLPQRKIRADFPDELRQTPDYGYVIFDMVHDEKGKVLARGPHYTLPAYQKAVDGSLEDLRWAPAKRDGKGVNSETEFAVIFNPAAAAEKQPDASPRLLEVAAAHVEPPKGSKGSWPDEVVFADLTVNETGRVTEVKNAPPELARACTIAAKNWRFAPARRAGQPVTATIHAPFIVEWSNPSPKGVVVTNPRAISQARPRYPSAMIRSGLKGEVLVDFVVDLEGRVRSAFVARTLNPAFDEPAIEAVRKWKFEPGRRNGVPVPTHMQVPVVFTLDNALDGGENGYEFHPGKGMDKLPEEFRFDKPPQPRGFVRPVYPWALLQADKEGSATVRFVVGQSGRVAAVDVLSATTPEFGRALAAAVELFEYEPALRGGRPSKALLSYEQKFERDDTDELLNYDDLALLRREKKHPETIHTLAEIDDKPKPLSQRPPHFPLTLAGKVEKGQALVEFLVDEDGRVHLPRVISATDEAFGWAAVQAAAAWQFEPMFVGGKSAVVRVRVPFIFGGEKTAPKPETK